MARSGVGGVPAAPDANFAAFEAPLLNDAGQLLLKATMEVGPGGVAAGNEAGLWTFDATGGSLVARTGSGGVPGVDDADFADFSALTFNENSLIALKAELAIGPGGVSAANNHGIWLVDSSGQGELVARTGATFAGRTIAAVDILGGSGGGDGRARSLNSRGQLVYKTTFTNGDEALVLFSPPSPADFDGDGDVDAADLGRWLTGFGVTAMPSLMQGNADGDGDVDGADFLIWQRQLSAPLSVPAAGAVPEPGAAALLCIGLSMLSLSLGWLTRIAWHSMRSRTCGTIPIASLRRRR